MGKFKVFKEHHDRKTLTQFFPTLYEEYFAIWPPTPTEEDVETVRGVMEVAVATTRTKEERVSDFHLRVISILIAVIISGFIDGCTTELDQSTA